MFFYNCLLPELASPKHLKEASIREPEGVVIKKGKIRWSNFYFKNAFNSKFDIKRMCILGCNFSMFFFLLCFPFSSYRGHVSV